MTTISADTIIDNQVTTFDTYRNSVPADGHYTMSWSNRADPSFHARLSSSMGFCANLHFDFLASQTKFVDFPLYPIPSFRITMDTRAFPTMLDLS